MFDGKFFGFVAVGQMLYFRPLQGSDVHVMYVPDDLDAHTLAANFNSALNLVVSVLRTVSNFKF